MCYQRPVPEESAGMSGSVMSPGGVSVCVSGTVCQYCDYSGVTECRRFVRLMVGGIDHGG